MEQPTGLPKRAVIARTLHCRGCGYDLRGTRLESGCPECGRPVRDSIDRAIDPDMPRLPELRNPRAAGNALVMLVTAQAVVLVLVVAAPTFVYLSAVFDGVRMSGSLHPVGWALLAAAGVALAAGLFCGWVLLHPLSTQQEAQVRRSVAAIVCGHVLVAALCVAGFVCERIWTMHGRGCIFDSSLHEKLLLGLLLIAATIITLFGDAGVLNVIGERSRAYREAKGGRQSIRAMVAAWTLVALGMGASIIEENAQAEILRFARTIGHFAVAAGLLLILIGMGYLVVNAWWIRGSLRTPAGRLADLIRIEPDTTFMGQTPSPFREPMDARPGRPTGDQGND